MSDINFVAIGGRLAADPRSRPNGPTVLRVAVGRSIKDRATGEWKNESSFFDVVAWRDLSEQASSFRKGEKIFVAGSLRMGEWKDRNTGETKRDVTIIANEIGRPMDTRQPSADHGRPEYQAPQQAPQQYQQQQPAYAGAESQGGESYPDW